MQKTSDLFNLWNEKKQFLEFFQRQKIVTPWQIRIHHVGVNIGSEISKDWDFMRPVLILKTHLGGDLVLWIPFTTKYHEKYPNQYVHFQDRKKYWLDQESYLLLNQIKIVSIKRLSRKLNDYWSIPKVPFALRKIIQEQIKLFLTL